MFPTINPSGPKILAPMKRFQFHIPFYFQIAKLTHIGNISSSYYIVLVEVETLDADVLFNVGFFLIPVVGYVGLAVAFANLLYSMPNPYPFSLAPRFLVCLQ